MRNCTPKINKKKFVTKIDGKKTEHWLCSLSYTHTLIVFYRNIICTQPPLLCFIYYATHNSFTWKRRHQNQVFTTCDTYMNDNVWFSVWYNNWVPFYTHWNIHIRASCRTYISPVFAIKWKAYVSFYLVHIPSVQERSVIQHIIKVVFVFI